LAVIVAEIGGSSFAVTDSIQLDRSQANEALKTRKVDLVIRLVPATETVCRVLSSPDLGISDRTSVADALGLLAESDLPAMLPWHRRSAGVLRLGGQQAALLAGWVSPATDAVDAAALSSIPEVWVAEVAALGALAHAAGTGAMVGLADQKSGALSVLALGPKRPVGRVLRIGASATEWSTAVQDAWRETAGAAGVDAPITHTQGLLMELPGSVRLGGANRDREWLNRNGLALGAIALYADPDAAVSSLVGLTPDEPSRAMPLTHRVVDWLSRPKNAAMVGAACIGALLFSPWVAAEARYAMLRNEAGELDKLNERLSIADQRSEFYKLLSQKRWPMTKLLADIAGAAPVGVTMESIELLQGDAINIRATAQTSELVSSFRKNLSDTMVFTDVATPTIEATGDGVTFQLQAKLTPNGAITASKPILDFAAETLSQRLYGANASPSARWEDEDSDRGSRRGDDRRSTGTRDRESSSRSSPREDRPAAPAAAPVIPPPLTDADIAAMDRDTAMKEWGVRRKASTQPGLDPAEKDRLVAEAEKCKARMQAATGGGA
jgi:Tfp pilus assembly protein PilN